MSYELHHGCVLDVLPTLAAASVQCCVTSPPYWGLRDYGTPRQLGLERTPEEYVSRMVEVFREVRRVLKNHGTLWLNLGDSYANDGKWGGETGGKQAYLDDTDRRRCGREKRLTGLKPKDLIGIPWRVALALQADGWYLRLDIIWHKPNQMPESVQDRPTKAHEYLFLLAKSGKTLLWRHAKTREWAHEYREDWHVLDDGRRINLWRGMDYFYDADAIKEAVTGNAHARGNGVNPKACGVNSRIYQDRDPNHPATRKIKQNESFSAAVAGLVDERNKRSVWTIATQPYPEAHFATFPEALVTPCILAGSRARDTILDPFAGSGTVGVVALRHQRRFVGIDLNAEYLSMARRRIYDDAPLLNGTL